MAAEGLEAALGLTFRNRQLLEHALVHRSSVNEQGWSPTDSYERMEYLGDAVLEPTAATSPMVTYSPWGSEVLITLARRSVESCPSHESAT